MPGGDRTGPMGMGFMTGRAAGYCAGNPVPGYMNGGAAGRGPGLGRGFGMGRGFGGGGRGWRNRYYATGLTGWQRAAVAANVAAAQPQPTPFAAGAATASKEQEIAALRQQAEMLGSSLDEIKRRIDEIQSQTQNY